MALPVGMALDSMDDVFLQDNLGPTIAEHALQCSHLFKKYMATPEIAPDPTVIDDQLARFMLWASNMDVFGPLNVSLDYRLRYSPTVVEIIHQLLDVIYNSLKSLKPIDDPPRPPMMKKRRIAKTGEAEVTKRVNDDASDTDSDEDQAQKNVEIITYTIGGTVARLFRLSNAIRKSAKASRTSKIGAYEADEEANNAITELRHYTECFIRFRFPQAPEPLRSALVEANALRLRRLYYQMSHRRRIALSVLRPHADPRNAQLPKLPDSAPAVRFASSALPKPKAIHERSKPTGLPPAPLTYATTARQTAVGALYANSTVETPRAKSILVNNELSFPPVPTTGECPYCGVIVEFKGTSKPIIWKDHVVRDLEPFVCIFANCTNSSQQAPGSLTFETSRAWMGHMQNAHSYAWECRAPSHAPIIFEQEVEFQEHSHREHDVPEAHVATLSSAARRPVLKKIRECPFGDDFSAPENTRSNTVFSNEALHLHVAAHMKEIALLALQKLPSDGDDKSEDVASDATLAEDGPAKLRRSMYSVLDDEALDFHDEADDGPTKLRGAMYSVLDDEALDFHDKADDGVSNIVEDWISSSINKLPSDGDDKSEDVASDAPLAEDGPAKLRGAMYSVLDDEALDFHDKADDGVSNIVEDGISSSINKLDLEDKDAAGMTRLHRAVQDNNLPLAQSLVDQGANLRSISNHGKTALHYASLNSDKGVDMMKLLLDSEARDIMSLQDDYGQTPLHYAAKKDFIDGIQLLVDSGVFIDIPDKYGFSPYLWAVIAGQYRATELLLSLGIDVNSTSTNGKSALSWAASLGHSLIAELLVTKGADVMPMTQNTQLVPLEEAAAYGDLSTVRLLLNSGTDPNYRDREGWSAIHWAAEEGHYEVVSLLLKHGANVNGISSYGTSPLHCAANGGRDKIVNELLQHGADPLMTTCHGWTPLHHAAFMGHARVVQSLLNGDQTASGSSQGYYGWTALHLAVHMRHLDTVRVLLGISTISESRLQSDERGLTAEEWLDLETDSHYYKTISKLAFDMSRCCRAVTRLRQAARDGNIVMTELLLELGNSVHYTNSGRRNALYYAARKDHFQILNVLLEKGADPNTLPAGLRTWEEFISDDTTLQRLRQAGYMKPIPNPEIDEQIRLALRERGEPFTLSQLASQDSQLSTNKKSEPVGKAEEPRSRVASFWKRLRGQ